MMSNGTAVYQLQKKRKKTSLFVNTFCLVVNVCNVKSRLHHSSTPKSYYMLFLKMVYAENVRNKQTYICIIQQGVRKE
jgi:hypothetical protein